MAAASCFLFLFQSRVPFQQKDPWLLFFNGSSCEDSAATESSKVLGFGFHIEAEIR